MNEIPKDIMKAADIEAIRRKVWNNKPGKRYLPRGYGNGGFGWGIWDCRSGAYVEDEDVPRLDPEERYAN